MDFHTLGKNDGTNLIMKDEQLFHLKQIDRMVPFEKDPVLREQQTRKTKPFQQEYYMCEEFTFDFYRNMAS